MTVRKRCVLSPTLNGKTDLCAGSVEIPTFAKVNLHLPVGVPDARQRSRQRRTRSFTIASSRLTRHSILPTQCVWKESLYHPTVMPINWARTR